MKTKKLTKEQQFDFELFYKPLLQQCRIGMNNLVDKPFELFYSNLHVIFHRDFDGLCDFLAYYEDNINWTKAIIPSNIYKSNIFYEKSFIEMNPLYFTELYGEHFNSKIWNYLSHLASFSKFVDFLEIYQDNVNWKIVSKNKNFSFKELQRYGDKIYWKDFIHYNHMSPHVKSQLITYIGTHIREFDLEKKSD